MAIPVQSRWWIATLLVVLVLVLISALALDQPDVVWSDATPYCPFCRNVVRLYSHRCAECNGEFDWVVASKEESPISSDSLSVLAAEWLRERVKALGPEESAARASKATGLPAWAADAYLHSIGRGDCGWCGGTRKDLASQASLEDADTCSACFGTGRSIGCGGDRRVRLGDQSAARALAAYAAELHDLDLNAGPTSPDAKRKEARRLAERFLTVHAGTPEAQDIVFWPRAVAPSDWQGALGYVAPTVSEVCRARLRAVVKALRRAE